jgi:hypothetical protein
MTSSNQFTAEAVHDLLRKNLKARPDLGMANALAERIVESRNPFEPEAVRTPQRWFVLCCLLTLLAAFGFVYFNLLR